MTSGNKANDNDVYTKGIWIGYDHPDHLYVEEYLAKALRHFQDCNINHEIIIRNLEATIVKALPGEPFDKNPEEGALRSALHCLWSVKDMALNRIRWYENAIARAERNRQAADKK